jgi:hypothetical protein
MLLSVATLSGHADDDLHSAEHMRRLVTAERSVARKGHGCPVHPEPRLLPSASNALVVCPTH